MNKATKSKGVSCTTIFSDVVGLNGTILPFLLWLSFAHKSYSENHKYLAHFLVLIIKFFNAIKHDWALWRWRIFQKLVKFAYMQPNYVKNLALVYLLNSWTPMWSLKSGILCSSMKFAPRDFKPPFMMHCERNIQR